MHTGGQCGGVFTAEALHIELVCVEDGHVNETANRFTAASVSNSCQLQDL